MATKAGTATVGYDVRKYVAELIGTMALVFFGCGAAVLAGKYIGFLGIAFAFGMVLLVMVYAIGPISGCHVNPAVTLGMLAARKISVRDAAFYIIVQCIGAILGSELVLWIALGMPGYKIGINGLGQNGFDAHSPGGFTMQAGFIAEVVLTFFFILAIFGATSKAAPKGFAGVGIGFSLFIAHIVGIPVTGTSVNPARSLGPALLVGGDALNQLWLFWAAPIIGAILAAAVWVLVLAPPEPKPAVAPRMIKVKEAYTKNAAQKVRPAARDEDLEEGDEEEAGEDEEDEEEEDDKDK